MPVPTPVPNAAEAIHCEPLDLPWNTCAAPAPFDDAPNGPAPAIEYHALITWPGDAEVAAQLAPVFAVAWTVPSAMPALQFWTCGIAASDTTDAGPALAHVTPSLEWYTPLPAVPT